MKAIILAGGKGSRFKELTQHIPKALLPIGGQTLIEKVLDTLPDSIDTIIITTKYLGEKIESHIGTIHQNKKVLYAKQPKDQDGTWAALYCAKEFIEPNEVFCICNCDDIFDISELKTIIENQKPGLGATRTILPAKYHGVRVTNDQHLDKLERHANENREELVEDIFTNGFFILDESIFSFSPVVLADGELGLPQTILAQKDRYPLYVYEMNHWQPCNTPQDLEKIYKGL